MQLHSMGRQTTSMENVALLNLFQFCSQVYAFKNKKTAIFGIVFLFSRDFLLPFTSWYFFFKIANNNEKMYVHLNMSGNGSELFVQNMNQTFTISI